LSIGEPQRILPWRFLVGASLLLLLPLLATPSVFAAQPAGLRGLTLEEALGRLEAEGVHVVYSSRLVRPGMRVEAEPSGATAIERLTSLLVPFGLTARAAPGGRFVVVRAARDLDRGDLEGRGLARLEVSVLDRRSRRPLAGTRVTIGSSGRSAVTGEDGRAVVGGLPPGVYAVEVEAETYPPASTRARLRAGSTERVRFELEVPVVPLEEIVVTPSRVEIARSEPETITELDQQSVLAAPSPGDDVFRATSALPGVARSDLSAQFNLRGGRADEVLVLLDGVELYEPYHLRDLGSALSIVAPQIVDTLELHSGGFSAAHGDRMSGLMAITTVRPSAPVVAHLGLSLVDASAALGGRFWQDRGHALVVARHGLLEEVLELRSDDTRPRFWDAFAKVALQPGARHSLRLETIRSEDFFAGTRDDETSRAGYDNDYLWGAHQGILGSSTVVDTLAWAGRFDRERSAFGDDETRTFSLLDRRAVEVVGLAQDWSRQIGLRQSLRWGVSLRRIRAEYEVAGELSTTDPLAALRTNGPAGRVDVDVALRGRQDAAYASYRRQLGRDFTLEAGLRFDENRVIDDEHLSPRLNLAWGVGVDSVLRFGLGEYTQSQRAHELDAGDGVVTLAQDERAQQAAIGFERFFARGLSLRAEAYHRRIVDPKPRWENLFDPFPLAPEAGADRVRLDPEDSSSQGVEVFVRRALASRYGWSAGYAWSSVEDRYADGWSPRSIDQPHALSLGLDLRLGRHWRFHADWRGHTGWPTTALSARLDEGDEGGEGDRVEPVLGPLNGERLPDFHRLDLRLSRELALPRGVLTVFVDVLNAYDRKNRRGYGITLGVDPGDPLAIEREPRDWTRRLASIGARWDF
jgi:hypothetical protein